MSQVRGVLLLAAEAAGLAIHEYAPRQVKLAVAGNGNASKEQVAAMVVRSLRGAGAFGTPDESDALAIALCHAHQHGARERLARAAAPARGAAPRRAQELRA
jgi:crossover junction endodeoxyribonuclease RuvC